MMPQRSVVIGVANGITSI